MTPSLHKSVTIAYDHFRPAVDVLATSDDPLKKRLIEAWTSHLSRLDGVELDHHVQKRFEAIRNMVETADLAIDAIEQLTPEEAERMAMFIIEYERDLYGEIMARQ